MTLDAEGKTLEERLAERSKIGEQRAKAIRSGAPPDNLRALTLQLEEAQSRVDAHPDCGPSAEAPEA